MFWAYPAVPVDVHSHMWRCMISPTSVHIGRLYYPRTDQAMIPTSLPSPLSVALCIYCARRSKYKFIWRGLRSELIVKDKNSYFNNIQLSKSCFNKNTVLNSILGQKCYFSIFLPKQDLNWPSFGGVSSPTVFSSP